MPNLQDVAKLAGVSTATVSKVLSNTPYVSEPTRQKVMEAVAELGYRPHLAARSLVTGKTQTVGVVFPYLYDALFKDPLVLAILEGIEDELTQKNYHLLLSTPRFRGREVDDTFYQLMQSGYLDGLIAIDSVPHSPITTIVKRHNIPLVVLGYHNAPYNVHSDDYLGGQNLMQHVLSLGHRRVGIISVPSDKNTAVNERVRGLRDATTRQGLDFDALPCVEGDFSTRSGAILMAQLRAQNPDLTAVICINDRMAIGAIQHLQAQGVRVPQDVSVVGYDNLSLSELITPALTTVSQHATQLGRKSAQMLISVLNGETPFTAVIPPTLLVRGSTASPR